MILRWRVVVAFAAVYLIWGSTYLAIRFAVETLPPFLPAGVRFAVAGGVLYGWARLRGASRPTLLHWKSAMVVGGLLLLIGNGGIMWAEQTVPSGLTALLVSGVPIWMVLLGWVRPSGIRPSASTGVGIALGFAGVALLVSSSGPQGSDGPLDLVGVAVILLASFSWALGSVFSREARLPASPLMSTGLQMLSGGFLLLVAGTLVGEWTRLEPGAMSPRSIVALGYLTVFGSIVAFTAYIWLLKATTPARASTYAFVNPVVAILLGWALAGESLSLQTLVAGAIVLAAVVIITSNPPRKGERRESEEPLVADPTHL